MLGRNEHVTGGRRRYRRFPSFAAVVVVVAVLPIPIVVDAEQRFVVDSQRQRRERRLVHQKGADNATACDPARRAVDENVSKTRMAGAGA